MIGFCVEVSQLLLVMRQPAPCHQEEPAPLVDLSVVDV